MASSAGKLLFFVSEDWFFCSHFLERAVAAKQAGYEVWVLTRAGKTVNVIEMAGLNVLALDVRRRSLNPLHALQTLLKIIQVYRQVQPDIVHHVALKPILMGTLAARLSGVHRVVNAVVGMGFVFSSNRMLARSLRPGLSFALKRWLNPPGSKVVFENKDDMADFIGRGWVRETNAVLIRGAGVEPSLFNQGAIADPVPLVMLVARMLWDKGVQEFVEAARLLKGAGARFVLVGDVDEGNRGAIPRDVLDRWIAEGVVEWWGFRSDMPAVLAQASIACLPSYREGLPKSLLEAMAAGLPCVTTDVPGCREAVKDGDNGLLVPARDPASLANALEHLINDASLRARMGTRGREKLESEFSTEKVVAQTLALYTEILPQ